MWTEFIDLLIPAIVFGSQVALMSLGFAVSYWPSREINFAIGGVYATAAYVMWWLNVEEHQPIELAILASLALTLVLQMVIRELVYRSLRREALVFLASFAVYILLENLLQLLFSPNPQSMPLGSWTYHEYKLLGPFQASLPDLLNIGLAVLSLVSVWMFLHHTRIGRASRAVISDPGLALCAGIRPRRIATSCYLIGGVIVLIAAVLASYQYGLTPSMGTNPVFYALNATLVGGRGNVLGAAYAGMLIGIVSELSILFFPSEWTMAVAFGVLFIMIVFRPNGIFKSMAWS